MVHEPGIEMFYGVLDPNSFLYMRRFNISKAVDQHRSLQESFKEMGVEVLKLKELIINSSRTNPSFRKFLETTALNYIKFEGDGEVEKKAKGFIKDIEDLDDETLFNVILLSPTVLSHEALGTSDYFTRILNEEPLANLYFTRDQSIITDKGLIIGRMSKRARSRETVMIKLGFLALGEKPIKEISEPAFLEGGDYLALDDFVIFGTGDRTSIGGIVQAMEAVDFDEVIVAYNPVLEHYNDYALTMHLDMYINSPKQGVIVGNPDILSNTTVDVYEKKEKGYTRKKKCSLLSYLKSKGLRIISVSLGEQLLYATNFLTLKDGKFISPDVKRNLNGVKEYLARRNYEDLLNKLKLKDEVFPETREVREEGLDFIVVDVSELTGGFGGIHCMTTGIRKN
ncbi:hypothetical protein CM19_04955 [Candidatus Acidianus copahuensis]|uniref:Amidinotransferase n=1 Tax=Candidatus Acidianus copahuensis TaxID=1160895 RepID=A0A031LN60_9CREN|nr:hypothetical protein CM19_04955 [Candidatus Acidianus copahuensis]